MLIRIITAIIAILFFFPFVFIGGLPFQVIMYLIATIGLVELLRMRKITSYWVPTGLSLLLLWSLLIPKHQLLMEHRFELFMLIILLLLAYTVLMKNKFTFEDCGFLILSAIYVGLGFYYFMETREAGLVYIFYAILVILSTDTGAYFFGRAIGKNKLWPEISPNKTIEGALGGIFLAAVVALVFNYFFPVHSSIIVVLLVTIAASIFAQIGDLVESAIKRYYHVKDSGKLLPGHGGILDRFDSWLFVFPMLHVIQFIT